MTPRYVIPAILGTLTLGVLGFLAWQTDFGRALFNHDVEVAPRQANLDTKMLPPYKLGAIDPTYRETVERPLFVPTRKPAPPANMTPAVTMRKGQFRLAGTSVNDQQSYVFLVETSTNKTHRLAQGAEVNGIRVDSIAATRVVLKQGEDVEELRLVTATGPRVATAPQAGAMPGMPQMPGQPGMPPQVGVTTAPQPAFAGAPTNQGGPNRLPQAVTADGSPIPVPAPPGAQGQTGQSGQSGQFGAPGVLGNDASNPQANTPPQPDPNSPMIRRRRFQNLPQ
jgi:general secretion pathway protein N